MQKRSLGGMRLFCAASTQEAADSFKEGGIQGTDAIIAYLWQNVLKMRKENAPIKGAPSRGEMPHTQIEEPHHAPSSKPWSDALQEGMVNVAP